MTVKPVKYKEFKNNPRRISAGQKTKLEDTLRRLGDLSGIVYNRRSKQFVGGNQRSKAMKFDDCELTMTETFDKPDKQGTTGWGFITWEGGRYTFREVDWSPKKEEEANIVANKGGGDWNFESLKDHFKSSDLLKWGFTKKELDWVEDEATPSTATANVETIYQVVIDCANIAEQEAAFNHCRQKGYTCRVLSL